MFKKARLFAISVLLTILTFTLFYNACSPQSFYAVKFSKIPDDFLHGFSIEINNGSYSISKLENVPLRFGVPEKNSKGEIINYEMKISQTSDCSDGEWKPYQRETTWTFLSDEEEEKLLFVYVKFREKKPPINSNTKDLEEIQRESQCIYKSIVHDTIAPRNLTLDNKPEAITSQKNAEFRFTAEDYSPIQFQCRLTKPSSTVRVLWNSCDSGKITYNSSDLAEDGEYTFWVKATDLAGNPPTVEKHKWTIDSRVPSLTVHCPDDSSDEVESVLVEASDLDFLSDPRFSIHLYCKPYPNTRYCGIIPASSPTKTFSIGTGSRPLSHFTTKEKKAKDYFKKTLFVQAKDSTDPVEFLSNPETCTWYEDTANPEIHWFAGGHLEYSFGENITYPEFNTFKVKIEDNSLLLNNSNSNIKVKYRVYETDTGPSSVKTTCGGSLPSGVTPTSSPASDGNGWCELLNNSPPYPTKLTTNDETYLTQRIYIDKGLTPGITNTPREHTIEIKAEDAFGRTSGTMTDRWDVYGAIEEKHVSVHSISNTSIKKADILFVIADSSGSQDDENELVDKMEDASNALSASFPKFIRELNLENVDWQIAVTSMNRNYRSGNLVQLIHHNTRTFLTNKYILCPDPLVGGTVPYHCPSSLPILERSFKRTITRNIRAQDDNNFSFQTLGHQYGILILNSLIDHFAIARGRISSGQTITHHQSALNSFFRENSTFVVILITNERNCGCAIESSYCGGSDIRSLPTALINQVKSILGEDKKFIFYPIIPEPGEGYRSSNPPICSSGYPANDEDDYWTLAKLTQGRQNRGENNPALWVDFDYTENRTPQAIPDGCDSEDDADYREDLCMIARDISKTTTSIIQLKCNPITNTDLKHHQIKYFYSSRINAPKTSESFNAITRGSNGTATVTDGNNNSVRVTIHESWRERSFKNHTNRVTLGVRSGNKIPSGTYKVEYFCYK